MTHDSDFVEQVGPTQNNENISYANSISIRKHETILSFRNFPVEHLSRVKL